jgi:hypothetical protein
MIDKKQIKIKLEQLRTDFRMLLDGSWIPEKHSINASIENLNDIEELFAKYERKQILWLDPNDKLLYEYLVEVFSDKNSFDGHSLLSLRLTCSEEYVKGVIEGLKAGPYGKHTIIYHKIDG